LSTKLTAFQKILALTLVSSALLAIWGCGTSPDLQAKIRAYFYQNQAVDGKKFVDWANKNLSEYSASGVMDAIYAEAQYHAGLGHPNAVGIMSFAARAWAADHKLNYRATDWAKLQEEAVSNIRPTHANTQLWPKE